MAQNYIDYGPVLFWIELGLLREAAPSKGWCETRG